MKFFNKPTCLFLVLFLFYFFTTIIEARKALFKYHKHKYHSKYGYRFKALSKNPVLSNNMPKGYNTPRGYNVPFIISSVEKYDKFSKTNFGVFINGFFNGMINNMVEDRSQVDCSVDKFWQVLSCFIGGGVGVTLDAYYNQLKIKGNYKTLPDQTLSQLDPVIIEADSIDKDKWMSMCLPKPQNKEQKSIEYMLKTGWNYAKRAVKQSSNPAGTVAKQNSNKAEIVVKEDSKTVVEPAHKPAARQFIEKAAKQISETAPQQNSPQQASNVADQQISALTDQQSPYKAGQQPPNIAGQQPSNTVVQQASLPNSSFGKRNKANKAAQQASNTAARKASQRPAQSTLKYIKARITRFWGRAVAFFKSPLLQATTRISTCATSLAFKKFTDPDLKKVLALLGVAWVSNLTKILYTSPLIIRNIMTLLRSLKNTLTRSYSNRQQKYYTYGLELHKMISSFSRIINKARRVRRFRRLFR